MPAIFMPAMFVRLGWLSGQNFEIKASPFLGLSGGDYSRKPSKPQLINGFLSAGVQKENSAGVQKEKDQRE